MVDRGALTPNEWRKIFNLAPVEGGDEPIRRLDTRPTSEGVNQAMEIQIKGTIIPNEDKNLYEYYGYENTCPKDVSTAFEKVGDDENVDIYINSGGGDIFQRRKFILLFKNTKIKQKFML